jgi:hypothetical protein
MKKFKLQLDELRVEQFQTECIGRARGTVRGLEDTLDTPCVTVYCDSFGASDPCRYCVDMPDTYSCNPSGCC